MIHWVRGLLIAISLMFSACPLAAGEAHVAVAFNFLKPLLQLKTQFESETGHRLIVSPGSTGKLYAQIHHGAPYDLFLAANEREPSRLEGEGMILAGSRMTYALGRLALWSMSTSQQDPAVRLKSGDFRKLSIANPKLAPYGEAAVQVLTRLKLQGATAGKLVYAENVSQSYQFVATRNVELGFVALSQMLHGNIAGEGKYWTVPVSMHEPIRQQIVMLRSAGSNQTAKEFYDWLTSSERDDAINALGYGRE